MARDAELRARITAQDDASKVIDKVADAGSDLESHPVEMKVDADVANVLSAFDQVAAEAKQTADAAEVLSRALGPELTAQANVSSVVSDLRDMGLTFDQIKGNADELGGKLKELADADVGGKMGSSLGTAQGKMDDLGKSADSSRSVLANMVGNATQDLGALTGIAGSAGVAIGQMGEYMADARASGEGFGSILKNFGTQALPIAAIGIGIKLISDAFEASKAKAKALAEATERVVDALLHAQDAGKGATDALEGLGDEAASNKFKELGDDLQPTLDTLDDLGLKWGDVVEAFGEGTGPVADAIDTFRQMDKTLEGSIDMISGKQLYDGWKLIAEGQGLSVEAAKEQYAQYSVLNDAIGDQVTMQDEAVAQGRSLTDFRQEYSDEQRKGAEATKAEEKAQADANLTTEEAAKLSEEAAQAADEYAQKVIGATGALAELSSTFDQMGMRGDALQSIFDLGDAPLDMAGEVRDIEVAISELSDAAKGIDLSAPLDPSNVKADKLLDALDALRPQIQAKLVEAFSTGGPEAATTMAGEYIDKVTQELGGKLTREEVQSLLGLDNIEASVAVAMEMSSVEAAKRQLAILTGIKGESAYTASIALALDAGTITGAQAQTLIQSKLGDAGVEIPSSLQAPETAEAVAEANAALKGTPVTVPSSVDLDAAVKDMGLFTGEKRATRPVDVPANAKPGEGTVDSFTGAKRSTDPVSVDANTKAAIATMLYLRILAAVLAPEVQVTAETTLARNAINALGQLHPRVPVDAYLSDYPTASEIVARIGRPRVPVDIVVGSSFRITGVRE